MQCFCTLILGEREREMLEAQNRRNLLKMTKYFLAYPSSITTISSLMGLTHQVHIMQWIFKLCLKAINVKTKGSEREGEREKSFNWEDTNSAMQAVPFRAGSINSILQQYL